MSDLHSFYQCQKVHDMSTCISSDDDQVHLILFCNICGALLAGTSSIKIWSAFLQLRVHETFVTPIKSLYPPSIISVQLFPSGEVVHRPSGRSGVLPSSDSMPYIYDKSLGQRVKKEMEMPKLLNAHLWHDVGENGQNFDKQIRGMSVDEHGRKNSHFGFNSLSSRSYAANDWSKQAVMKSLDTGSYCPAANKPSQQQFAQAPQRKAYRFESETFPEPVGYTKQPSVWSPPRSNGPIWGTFEPNPYCAPVVPPRYVQLPEHPITPHDTYRYPNSHHEHIYVAPVAPAIREPDVDTVNAAFSVWYAQQVIQFLVVPGQLRQATGGASDEKWGAAGREVDSWSRVGRVPLDAANSWGRMGMIQTTFPAISMSSRRPNFEQHDPWNVEWAHARKPSATFTSFILDMIQRMTISPSALVAAVWYLAGLGLHEGDGVKGAKLRKFLREHVSCEPEAVEKRVAMLGLILAGKWLDDNSFLTKSWCEVTAISTKQIDTMERLALVDFNFSLYVPVFAWVDHVNQLFTALDDKPLKDDTDSVVHFIIEKMTKEAREVELNDPAQKAIQHNVERRVSSGELPAAADQLTNRDWLNWSRSYAHDQKLINTSEDDVELERAERNVEMLLNEDMNEVEDFMDEDEEEEFLDYDGAKRWLPSAAEMKRSASNFSHCSESFGAYAWVSK
ncbi:hypothetical protein L204_104051 [Cryptococcus depauperatus]